MWQKESACQVSYQQQLQHICLKFTHVWTNSYSPIFSAGKSSSFHFLFQKNGSQWPVSLNTICAMFWDSMLGHYAGHAQGRNIILWHLFQWYLKTNLIIRGLPLLYLSDVQKWVLMFVCVCAFVCFAQCELLLCTHEKRKLGWPIAALEQPQQEVAGKRRQHHPKLQPKCKAIKTQGMFILTSHRRQNH